MLIGVTDGIKHIARLSIVTNKIRAISVMADIKNPVWTVIFKRLDNLSVKSLKYESEWAL